MLDNKIWTCSPTQPRVKLPPLQATAPPEDSGVDAC
jgi:hypothetical protein